MTSLFRRSNSTANSRSSSTQELNNSRPVRRLEFNQAMEDFKTMFPNMDYDIIECVLRANNGAVDATIDQLLQMNLDESGYDDSSDSDDSIPPEILERTLEPDSSDEEPPPVYSPPTVMPSFDRSHAQNPPAPPLRTDVLTCTGTQVPKLYKNWNPPLLGNLPDDFLRILPQQMDSVQLSHGGASSLCDESKTKTKSMGNERNLNQYLHDEQIALFLQNEEFMRELQRNREFLLALERDRLKYESKKSKSRSTLVNNGFGMCPPISADEFQGISESSDSNNTISEDALFRDKLKHMGKSTRKKLFEIARSFSEKTKIRKSMKKRSLRHQVLSTAASTANLLDDVEDEDVQTRIKQQSPDETETQSEGQSKYELP
ncbi:CUE domain-containing protein 1 isoform X2 [Pelobates fuscus]|uniref:CUE domain-containing protein 1 isoform X2 n=1 Tax=Pelobates fuscus TaxID=191477 RepID=UPI002FE4CCC3